METNIQIFRNETFGEIRTMTNEKGETFFVGKDVAMALGYSNPLKALRVHVDDEDKGVTEMGTPLQFDSLLEAATGEGFQTVGDERGAASHQEDGPLRAAAAGGEAAGRAGRLLPAGAAERGLPDDYADCEGDGHDGPRPLPLAHRAGRDLLAERSVYALCRLCPHGTGEEPHSRTPQQHGRVAHQPLPGLDGRGQEVYS